MLLWKLLSAPAATSGTAVFNIRGVNSNSTLNGFKYSFDNLNDPKKFCVSVPLAADTTSSILIDQDSATSRVSPSGCF